MHAGRWGTCMWRDGGRARGEVGNMHDAGGEHACGEMVGIHAVVGAYMPVSGEHACGELGNMQAMRGGG